MSVLCSANRFLIYKEYPFGCCMGRREFFKSKMRKPAVSSSLRFLSFLLLISPVFHSTAKAEARNYLERGATLSVQDEKGFITSPDKSFTCGFYGDGSNAYWFAIWFTNSRDKTVVWMANRDRPVNGHGSQLSLRRNGAMVLTDVDGFIVWQTNTTSTDVTRAELLDSGNLVLKNFKGDILWQSFDFPTDTLLPAQTITKSKRLVSPLRKGSYESGYYSLYFDSDNVLRMIYDGPDISSIYWPNPDYDVYRNGRTNWNSRRIAGLDDMGIFRSSDQLQFNVTDMGPGIKRRMTIDYDGNLRVYSLINSTGLWEISWQAVAQPTAIRGMCGRNGICLYSRTGMAECLCPPGYVVIDPSDWNKGCKATFDLSRSNPQQVEFMAIPHADYYGFDLNGTKSITFEACRNICLGDSSCQGFNYKISGYGECYAKNALFNGYYTPDFPGTIYIKVPHSFQIPERVILQGSRPVCGATETEQLIGSSSMYDGVGKRVRWVYLYSFCSALGAIEILFVALGWFFLFRKTGVPATVEAGYHMIASQFRRFSYDELKKATNNFKEELGRGGSGAVYKGELADGRKVGVKKLGDVFQAEQEFWAEMSTIGKINHMNLVRMWGYCSERRRKLLVYEYVENSSLDKHLFDTAFLGWKQRFAVALGTAKGLAYLHHECLEWVIHCDVKPENILLDGDLQPKIADFGLAKLSQRGGPGSQFTRIRGTKGYMAPEWALNQPITAKVDVYSYGVVILEMVKGIRLSNWSINDGNEQEAELTKLVRIIKRKMQQEEQSWLDDIVDPRLQGKFSRNQVITLIQVGISCVEEDRNKRPTMASVAQTLQECEDDTVGF